ncbi:hypothetical protein BaRGS_00007348 [Batillaria attramentaria]|uniref:Sodium-coupled monocarboxylate transporter 2 n=1 Tax=Batillaria attramentaria TaxID=370345 RepID=A0ABD0LPE9_9CAEN
MGEEDKYSINTGQIRTFSVADYILFTEVLIVCALVGLYYAWRDRRHVSTTVFMLGGKQMYVLPVAMSLAVTFLSAVSLLGNPVEVYNFNTMFWYLAVALLLAVSASAQIFIPFFYKLRVTTVFEYLQLRFNTPVRLLGSVVLILQTLVYFSFVLYAPSLALSAVTNLNVWGCVVGMSVVVTFYTTLGGMKAVLWTDTFQAVVILAGLLAALIRGSVVTGGFANAWDIANKRDRIKFDDFNVDPSTRHSFWSVVVGGGFFWMSLFGVNQAQVQRCMACPSATKAKVAMWVNLPTIVILVSIGFMIGVVMFAFYADCHPTGIISKNDQLLPLFVMDILADYEGIPGIFVACIFSGSLSTLSSGLNALSAVTLKDFIVPYCCPRISEFASTVISKILVAVYGCLGMAVAYVVSQFQRLLQASYSTYSILNGPMFGLFVLGMFFPWANSAGAFVGCIAGLVFMSWIGIGAFVHKVSTATPSPVITTGCKWSATIASNLTTTMATTASIVNNTTTAAVASDSDIPAYPIYTLSYLYYTITGATTVVVVGLIVSFITGYRRPSTLDPRLICPLFDEMFPCLPEVILKPLRFGIDHKDKYEKYDKQFEEIEAAIQLEIDPSKDVQLVGMKEINGSASDAGGGKNVHENAAFDKSV